MCNSHNSYKRSNICNINVLETLWPRFCSSVYRTGNLGKCFVMEENERILLLDVYLSRITTISESLD
jgi:hypothetical protein